MTARDTTPLGGNAITGCAALEVSGGSWILGIGDPSDASRTGMIGLEPHDVDGLLARLA